MTRTSFDNRYKARVGQNKSVMSVICLRISLRIVKIFKCFNAQGGKGYQLHWDEYIKVSSSTFQVFLMLWETKSSCRRSETVDQTRETKFGPSEVNGILLLCFCDF